MTALREPSCSPLLPKPSAYRAHLKIFPCTLCDKTLKFFMDCLSPSKYPQPTNHKTCTRLNMPSLQIASICLGSLILWISWRRSINTYSMWSSHPADERCSSSNFDWIRSATSPPSDNARGNAVRDDLQEGGGPDGTSPWCHHLLRLDAP